MNSGHSDNENEYSTFQIQKAIISEAAKDWKYYIIGIFAMFAGVQARLTNPILIRLVIDDVIVEKDASNLNLYVGGIVGIAVLGGILNYGNRYFNDKAAEETIFRLRNKIFNKIQGQSLGYLYKQETGQLITRTINDLNIIKQYLRRHFRLGLDGIYYLLSIGIIIYITQPRFLIVVVLLLPFLLVISWIYANKSRPLFRKRREFFGDMSSLIQENIAAIPTIHSFATEVDEAKRFDQKNQDYLNLYIKAELIRGLTLPVATLIVSLASVGVFLVGGIDIISGIEGLGFVSLGMLVQFNLYMLELVTPTRLLGNFLVGYTRTNVSGQRVLEVLWAENEIKEVENAKKMSDPEGNISFQNVQFSYDNQRRILRDINLEIKPNQTLAIFGSTASGKTTLINLIPRFFDPTQGTVKIDDIDIKKYELQSLRRNVATVSQDIFLFSRTIKENITFGRPDATNEEIIQAAKASKAHNFILSLENEYDTVVGERGITLSGGQQQRLTLTRAILMDPKILILDDTTSSVDAETEFEIQEALEHLSGKRTTLIITHKVSSARFADKIIVMENGMIIENGSHEDLMELEGMYSKIYRSQKDPELEDELIIIKGET